MDRRTLLKTAAALAGLGRFAAAATGLRVVVAGAGIVGASIAWHLARAGASVTVIDKQGPATHASRGTFAWINATWAKQPRHYHRLNQDGLSQWKTLQQGLEIPVRWGGSLEWFDRAERQARLAGQIAEQVAWGEPARMLDADEFSALEPGVKLLGAESAAYSPNDGAVDPVLATRILLSSARSSGARIQYPCELRGIRTDGHRLVAVETSTGTLPADRLVVATGAEPRIPELTAGIAIPQRSTPGIIAVTRPLPRLIHRIIVAPGIHLHQRDDGRVVMGEQDGAPQTEAHAARLQGRPNDFPSPVIARQHGHRMLEIARRYVPEIEGAEIEQAVIGWRPLPIDGHPVLGTNPQRPHVYLAIMHSGVSLAPAVGQLVAQELTGDVSLDALAPYRPTRSFRQVRRY